MSYTENPKTAGSGILACIPHSTRCPHGCKDCFYQSGRSYLEPLDENLPNMPSVDDALFRVVRVNDGHDSGVDIEMVMAETAKYPMKFYNTIIPDAVAELDAPVVLTINPGRLTDLDFNRLDPIPANLMFVRFRMNTWNTYIADQAIEYYSDRGIPIVLTFMAYHDIESIPDMQRCNYSYRGRTINKYWAIQPDVWIRIMHSYRFNKWVYSCSSEGISSGCRFCGNCLREYFATMERMYKAKEDKNERSSE